MTFASPPRRARQIAEQEIQLEHVQESAEHLKYIHLLAEEMKEVLASNDPLPKFWVETLDPNVECIVRYEKNRWRYAIYTTDSAGTKVTGQFMGKQWTITTTGPGWLGLDWPPGTLLYSGDANRHLVLVRSSNMKV